MTGGEGIALALVATGAYNAGFVLEKRALARLPAIQVGRPRQLLRTLFTAPAWMIGFLCTLFGLGCQVVVLEMLPISVVQPLQAAGIAVLLVLAWLLLGERAGSRDLWRLAAVVVAVALLGLSVDSGTRPGTESAGGGTMVMVLGGSLLVAMVLYATAHRSAGKHHLPATGMSSGLATGLLYGMSGLGLEGPVRRTGPPVAGRHGRGAAVLAVPLPRARLVGGRHGAVPDGVAALQGVGGDPDVQRGRQLLRPGPGHLAVPREPARRPHGVHPARRRLRGRGAGTGDPAVDAPSPESGRNPAMALDDRLLDILACPIDKGALLYFPEDATLYNPRLRRLHRIEADVPLMRADDSQGVDPVAHRELVARAVAGQARATLRTPVADLLAALSG